MEVDTRAVQHASHHHHHHQPLRQVEGNGQSLPPPSIRSPTAPVPLQSIPQKSPSNPLLSPSPAVKSVHDAQYVAQVQPQHHPPPKEPSTGLTNRTRDPPPVISHVHSPVEQHRTNGQHYPRSPHEVQIDVREHLQTQVSQNSSALSVHSRDMRCYEGPLQHQEENLRREFQGQLDHQNSEIRRVDEAMVRLQHEMRGIRELLEALSREVQASRDTSARGMNVRTPGAPMSAQGTALELMADQVSVVSQKANEVDTLKITMEIMKNKIQRLEEAAVAQSVQQEQPQQQKQPLAHQFQSPREPSAHSAHSAHSSDAVQPYHSTPSTMPHINTPVHPTHRPQSFHPHGSHSPVATPEVSQRAEPAQTQSGWVTLNASAKRAHHNGVDGPHDPIGQPAGSPKRPKFAAREPRVAYGNSQSHPHQQHVYENMDTESLPESTLLSQHSQSPFAPYGTQDGPSDDSWRPESQRIVEHRTPRGRGRGGGPGSRGGRGRKSLPAQVQLGTLEWEKDDWKGVTESQTSPSGFYSPLGRSRGGIIRRGSGGGGGTLRGERPPSSSGRQCFSRRAVSLGLQGVTTGVVMGGMPMDPYAHTKKTRTKPIRNADGFLIRKDGRPDMRSQSSAANLRKVHARKEEEKGERGYTPGFQQTPSPTSFIPPGHDLTTSVQKKHSFVMNKMFPRGLDESRKAEDNARKVLEEQSGQHARGHHHHQGIKREQVENSRLADHGDDEGQTPSDNSDQTSVPRCTPIMRRSGRNRCSPKRERTACRFRSAQARSRKL